jgi:hypothetical protein
MNLGQQDHGEGQTKLLRVVLVDGMFTVFRSTNLRKKGKLAVSIHVEFWEKFNALPA